MLSQNAIQQQLDLTNQMIQKLNEYQDRTINNLPDNIQLSLKKLPVYKNMTSSGFEKVSSILMRLYISQYYLQEAYENPEKFKKKYSQKTVTKLKISQSPQSNPPQKPISPQIKINPNTLNATPEKKPQTQIVNSTLETSTSPPKSEADTESSIKINLNNLYEKPEDSSSQTSSNNKPLPPSSPPPSSNIDL